MGVPAPVITWYKDGRPLVLHNVSNIRSLDDGAKLEIQTAELTDEGTYECRAVNDAGQDRVHYQLKVLGM